MRQAMLLLMCFVVLCLGCSDKNPPKTVAKGPAVEINKETAIPTTWSLPVGAKMRIGKGGIDDIKFSPDGNRLASGSDKATVRLWDVATGGHLNTLPGHTIVYVNSVSFSPDGNLKKKLIASYQKEYKWDKTVRSYGMR